MRIVLGQAENGERIELTSEDLETYPHIHGVGATRTGKSKLVESIVRQIVKQRGGGGLCLIDPHGSLYEDIVEWLAYLKPRREVVLFNPSFPDRIVGFNPFMGRGESGDVSVEVDRRVRATVKAWGAEGTNETPRLERWLRTIFHTLLEQGLSLEAAYYLLSFEERDIRDKLVEGVKDRIIRNEWAELSNQKQLHNFLGQIESTRSRLFRFISQKQIQRVMGLLENNLDLEAIVEGGKILLVNLQPSEMLSDEASRLVGTLLLNDLWEIGRERKRGPRGRLPKEFFIVIDEFQRFLTPDISEMLDESGKRGYRLLLFHQHLSQLEEVDHKTYAAVMTNARTKLVFGGLRRADARTMVEEIFPGQVDLKRVKFLIEQTKFWPMYSRDTAYTRSSSKGTGSSSGAGSGAGTGQTIGESWNPYLEEWVASAGSSAFDSSSGYAGSSSFEGSSESETDIPIFIPVPFKEVSSITPYSLEETLWELSDRLMEQYQRHYFIRRPGRETVAAITPRVKSWRVSPERIRAYTLSQLEGFLTGAEVDERLEAVHLELTGGEARERMPALESDGFWEKE